MVDGALTMVVRRCIQPECPCYHVAYRPEEEGRWALPHGEFGLEVIALIGRWRFREHRSVPEMHQMLLARGVSITERSVTNLMQRYEELVALRVADQERIKARLQKQGRVILALDGLQPDVGARASSGWCVIASPRRFCWRVRYSVVRKVI